MQGLKYLTIAELEDLIDNLRAEINRFTSENSPHVIAILKQDEEMLRQAEDEVLERTLLGASNEGGSSE